MTMPATMFSPRTLRAPPVLAGGLLVGSLDLVFACVWWAVAANVTPIRIFQSIGAGVYGAASFEGGLRTAAVGGVLHYLIATAMVFAYAWAATRWRGLARQPWRWGPLYGLFLYALMNYVVVPLSAAEPPSKFNAPWVLASIAMHMLIGVVCAHVARRAVRG
jgi:hypothetical protein